MLDNSGWRAPTAESYQSEKYKNDSESEKTQGTAQSGSGYERVRWKGLKHPNVGVVFVADALTHAGSSAMVCE